MLVEKEEEEGHMEDHLEACFKEGCKEYQLEEYPQTMFNRMTTQKAMRL